MSTTTVKNGFISKRPKQQQGYIPFITGKYDKNNNLIRCSMRKNQQHIFDNYRDDNLVIIQQPGGSGKSTIVKFVFSYKLFSKTKDKCIIVIPQHMIAKSFQKVELVFSDKTIYWDINNNLCEKTPNGKVKELVDFINKPIVSEIETDITNRIALVTYQSLGFAWDALSQDEKENAIQSIYWVFDESHRVALSENEAITKVGDIISIGLKKQHLNPCFWLTSATQFRGDKCSIIPDEYYDKFKVDFLPLDKHWEENIQSINSFSYDFYVYKTNPFKELKTVLNNNKVPTLIICPPNNGKHGCKYTFANKIKEIAKDVYDHNVKILDFVHEKGRDQLKQEFLDGKHNDTDVILSVELMDEGVDWVKCAQVLDLNPSNSLRVQMQRIYRLWRDCPNKNDISYISFLRFCNKSLDEDNYKFELDKIVATWTGAMLIQDLISPIKINKLQQDKKINNSRISVASVPNAFQNAFNDPNKQDEVLSKVTEKLVILTSDCLNNYSRKPKVEETKECIENVVKGFGIVDNVNEIVNIIAAMFRRKFQPNYGIDLSFVVDEGFETIWKDDVYDAILSFGSNCLDKNTFQKFRDCFSIIIRNPIEQYNRLKKLVESKSGLLLTDKYVAAIIKIKVQCEHGHQWNATPNSLFNGTWCPACSGRNPIEQHNRLKELVESNNGLLLSDYVASTTKVKVQCKHGHQWNVAPSHLFNGRWCPTCLGRNPIEQQNKLIELVESKKGILLSSYIKSNEKVKVQCEQGHQWDATPNSLLRGTWCPTCAGKNKEYQQNKLKELVKSKNGILLSDYVDATTKVKIQCEHGHQWDVSSSDLFIGHWCPECNCPGINKDYQQNKLKELVKSKNGLLLSDYINATTKVKVQCENGHQWDATPDKLFNGRWCPTCIGFNREYQENKLKEIIKLKEGLLLSDYNKNNKTKVKVQCKHGHIWDVTPSGLMNNGTWCPTCARKK